MEQSPPPLFMRGPGLVARLVFFALLAVFLMVLDARYKYMEPLRQGLLWIVYPIQRAATAPVDAAGRITDYFITQTALQNENAALRAARLQDAQDLVKLEAMRQENNQLRQLLEAKQKSDTRGTFAEIIYLGRDPFTRKVIIDKGSQEGIELGRPVIDTRGLIGQVTRVHPLIAEVTLVIDKEHPVPVMSVRNGTRGVAYGSGDGTTMELRFLAPNVDISPGDRLVTSGIDGVYPSGLPVAQVQSVDRDATFQFARIMLAPTGGPGQFKEVLVLAKADAAPSYPEEAKPEQRPGKQRRQNPVRTKR